MTQSTPQRVAPANLEVNGSAEMYRFQVRPVCSCRTWRKWVGQTEVEDGIEDSGDGVYGLDMVTLTRASDASVLYGDPQSKAVWCALTR